MVDFYQKKSHHAAFQFDSLFNSNFNHDRNLGSETKLLEVAEIATFQVLQSSGWTGRGGWTKKRFEHFFVLIFCFFFIKEKRKKGKP